MKPTKTKKHRKTQNTITIRLNQSTNKTLTNQITDLGHR